MSCNVISESKVVSCFNLLKIIWISWENSFIKSFWLRRKGLISYSCTLSTVYLLLFEPQTHYPLFDLRKNETDFIIGHPSFEFPALHFFWSNNRISAFLELLSSKFLSFLGLTILLEKFNVTIKVTYISCVVISVTKLLLLVVLICIIDKSYI